MKHTQCLLTPDIDVVQLLQVTLTALGFWQDTYLAALLCLSGKRIVGHAQPLAAQLVVNAGSQPQLDEILAAHGPLLGSLMHALVLRSALTPAQAAYTSADARDLSEEVRMVRALCVGGGVAFDVGAWLGHAVERMVQAHAHSTYLHGFCLVLWPVAQARFVHHVCLLDHLQVRRELASALRDINGLVGQEHTLQYMWGLVGVTLASLNQQAAAAQSTAMSPQAHVRAWCQMECAVYAANVVLGR